MLRVGFGEDVQLAIGDAVERETIAADIGRRRGDAHRQPFHGMRHRMRLDLRRRRLRDVGRLGGGRGRAKDREHRQRPNQPPLAIFRLPRSEPRVLHSQHTACKRHPPELFAITILDGWRGAQLCRMSRARAVTDCQPGRARLSKAALRGCSSMAEQKLPKLTTGVLFPSPAPTL